MQKRITARRISFNLIALMGVLVTVAMLVGFVAGFAAGKPLSVLSSTAPAAQVQAQTNSPALAQPNAPIEGWIYHHDSLTNKWYAYHYAMTSAGPVIDDTYEMASNASIQVQPKGYAALKEAQLEQDDARIGTATFSMPVVPKAEGCKRGHNEPEC